METVNLRSIGGPVEFTRRVMIRHESGNEYLAPVTYRFSLDNGLRGAVPLGAWEELENEFIDSKNGIRYRDILKPI